MRYQFLIAYYTIMRKKYIGFACGLRLANKKSNSKVEDLVETLTRLCKRSAPLQHPEK